MRRLHDIRFALLVTFGLQAACSPDGGVTSTPLGARDPGATRFVQLSPKASGVDFENTLTEENVKKYLYNGSGIAVGDYDADGRPDLYLVSLDGPNKLYRQIDDMVFENVTVEAGVMGGKAWGTGASFADVDGDGDLDLYVCNLGVSDHLYMNEGDGRFIDRAERAGVAYPGASVMVAFADYDRDGDLDYYLLTNRVLSVAEEAPRMKAREINGELTVHPDYVDQYAIVDGHFIEAGQADRLFRNEGDGTFTEVSDEAGVSGFGMGLSVTWWDVDDDGWLDIYVANDLKTTDKLYHNETDGTFRDVLVETVPYTSWFSMGADIADVNGDGRFDLFVGDMLARSHLETVVNMGDMNTSRWFLETAVPRQYMRNTLFLNTGTERLSEVAFLAGVARTDWTWSVRFADLDNDGREDLFITTGMERHANDADWADRYGSLVEAGKREEAQDLLMKMPRLVESNLVYRNRGDLRFDDVSEAWGLDHRGVSHGAAVTDLDNDGDLDVVVNNLNERASVFRNDGGEGNAVLFDLVGRQSNRDGIGARLTVESASGSQVRLLTLARGYLSGDRPVVHVGLGRDVAVERLIVDWPSGIRQVLEGLPAGHLHRITEPSSEGAETPSAEEESTRRWFSDATGRDGLDFVHEESIYDDFAREPLLPHRLSRLGPAMVWGDANGDGAPDVYLGGAAGRTGVLLVREREGFVRIEGPWTSDARSEDLDALFFDIDGDGDEDLYVVSGSVECEPGDTMLADRLYLNDGNAGFSTSRTALPGRAESGSTVAAADVDRDGDLDLFVGTRVIPGRYPESGPSRLLENTGGTLRDWRLAPPSLSTLGLVTDARFADVNGDEWPDLIVAREWGSLALFRNDAGRLVDATKGSSLERHSGWWNVLEVADVDGDGDADIVAGNHGLNSRYRATRESPAELYRHDFDGDGRGDMVEVTHENGRRVPLRGRSVTVSALPFLAEKYATHRAYGGATFEEIFSRAAIDRSQRLEITTLASGVFLNDGTGRFSFRAFPKLAQTAPVFGIAAADYDDDGLLDLYLAQNFYSPQPEIGRLGAGLGALLRGAGDGSFRLVPPHEVGVTVPEDAKAAKAVDVDGDGAVDVVVATNGGPLRVLRSRARD